MNAIYLVYFMKALQLICFAFHIYVLRIKHYFVNHIIYNLLQLSNLFVLTFNTCTNVCKVMRCGLTRFKRVTYNIISYYMHIKVTSICFGKFEVQVYAYF